MTIYLELKKFPLSLCQQITIKHLAIMPHGTTLYSKEVAIYSVAELKEQALLNGFNDYTATVVANVLWGYNLTMCIINCGLSNNGKIIKVYKEHLQPNGDTYSVEVFIRKSTGCIIRQNRPKLIK